MTIAVMFLLAAAPSLGATQGTMPEWGRPLSPAEGRALNQTVDRLSGQLGVSRRTLAAIARALGTNLRDASFSELVRRVEEQSRRAAELQTRISSLDSQLRTLEDPAIRDPALQALQRADTAFREGRLADADREFTHLRILRRSQSDAAEEAWLQAVQAQARLAELRFDFDEADRLRLGAAEEVSRRADARRWILLFDAASARLRQGELRGDRATVEQALGRLERDVLPLAPRQERPNHWVATQSSIASGLAMLGRWENGTDRLRAAEGILRTLAEVLRSERGSDLWSIVQNNLGDVLSALSDREDGTASLVQSENVFRELLTVQTRTAVPLEWATTQHNLGVVLQAIGARTGSADKLQQAEHALREALRVRSRREQPDAWAATQSALGGVLMTRGEQAGNPDLLIAAVEAHRAALQVQRRELAPQLWARNQYNLGLALLAVGQREDGVQRLNEAVTAFESAADERPRQTMAALWAKAVTQAGLARAYIARRTDDQGLLDQAERDVTVAHATLIHANRPADAAWAAEVLTTIRDIRRQWFN